MFLVTFLQLVIQGPRLLSSILLFYHLQGVAYEVSLGVNAHPAEGRRASVGDFHGLGLEVAPIKKLFTF